MAIRPAKQLLGVGLSEAELAKNPNDRTQFEYDPTNNAIDRVLKTFSDKFKVRVNVTGADRSKTFIKNNKTGLSNHQGQNARDIGLGSNTWLKDKKKRRAFLKMLLEAGLSIGDEMKSVDGRPPHMHIDVFPSKRSRQVWLRDSASRPSDITSMANEILGKNKFLKKIDDKKKAKKKPMNIEAVRVDAAEEIGKRGIQPTEELVEQVAMAQAPQSIEDLRRISNEDIEARALRGLS